MENLQSVQWHPVRLCKGNLPEVDVLVANIVAEWAAASLEDRAYGLVWYQESHDWCQEVASSFGLSLLQVCQVTAALSPQIEWTLNQRLVLDLLVSWAETGQAPEQMQAYAQNVAKAVAILNGETVSWKGGPKTERFWWLLYEPTRTDCCCVDSHSGRIAIGDPLPGTLKIDMSAYPTLEQAHLQAAELVGVSAAHLQAATWVSRRNRLNRTHGGAKRK